MRALKKISTEKHEILLDELQGYSSYRVANKYFAVVVVINRRALAVSITRDNGSFKMRLRSVLNKASKAESGTFGTEALRKLRREAYALSNED